MKKVIMITFNVISYCSFLFAFLLWIKFCFTYPNFNSTPNFELSSIIFNSSILLLFIIQHSIMARTGFKENVTKHIPKKNERSLFVLISSSILILLFLEWRVIGGHVYHITDEYLIIMLNSIAIIGWLILFISTFLINHFHLFGLQQAYDILKDQDTRLKFVKPLFYQISRHPMMIGVFLLLWSTPTLTYDRLLFASLMSIEIFYGTWLEEKELVKEFGNQYTTYQKEVSKFLGFRNRLLD